MRFSNVVAALALVGGVLGTPAPARAINPDAQTFFAKGRSLRAEGKFEEAIVEFRRAFDLAPEGLGALRNIAECEEALGQYASARIDWWNLRRAALQTNDPKYQGWDKEAEAAYQKLELKVGRLTVQVVAKDLSRVTVTIDGKPLDPRLFGVEIERDLGVHTIQANYGGAAPIIEKRGVSASRKEIIVLKIPDASPADKPPGDTTPKEPPPPDRAPLRVGGYVSLAFGGAGVIGLISSIAIRQSAAAVVQGNPKECSFDAAKNVYTCPNTEAYSSAVDRGNTASLLVNVFTGVAVAGVGIGAVLLITSRAPGAAPKRVTIAPCIDGVWIKGSF